MLYSVRFFAAARDLFSGETKQSTSVLVTKTERWLRRELKNDHASICPILAAARELLFDALPPEVNQTHFDAGHAILAAIAEPISFSAFEDFRHLEFLEQTRIWPWTQREAPPIRLPRNSQPPPEFGFLSATFMSEVVISEARQLTKANDHAVQRARNLFLEVVESVSSEGLDMYTYLSVW